jgi:hypothetical protein
VLVALNALLGYCAVVGTLRPHFEVLFALSLGLTGCYLLCVVRPRRRPDRVRAAGGLCADCCFVCARLRARFMAELAQVHAAEAKGGDGDADADGGGGGRGKAE